METYAIPESGYKRKKSMRVARWFVWFAFSASLYFLVESVWPRDQRSVTERMVNALIWAAIFSFFSTRRQLEPARPQSVQIDGDVLVVKVNGKFRKLRRGEIRTFVERRGNFFSDGGLMLSEKTPFKSRMWGGSVWIPQETPEYQTIKNLAEMWQSRDVVERR